MGDKNKFPPVKRTLMGLQRVGPIALDMMLVGERKAHVVITCCRRPTRKLLEKVAGKTVEMLGHTERSFANFDRRKQEISEFIKLEKMNQKKKTEPFENTCDDLQKLLNKPSK